MNQKNWRDTSAKGADDEQNMHRGKLRKLSQAISYATFAVGACLPCLPSAAWASATIDGGVINKNPSGVDNGLAFGSGSKADSDFGVAVGPGAWALGAGDIAIGADAKVNSGAQNGDGGKLDAIAVGSNAKAIGASTTSFGARANASAEQATSIGAHSAASGVASFAGGTLTVASGASSLALGNTASAAGTDAIALGDRVKSTQNGAVSIGSQITNSAANSVVMGNNVLSLDADSAQTVLFAPNGGSVTNSANSFVFNPYGGNSTSDSSDSINLGGTVANAAGGVAIGSGSSVQAANAVALGAGSVAADANTVSVGNASQQRKIVNVAAGTQDTDVVNVMQLKMTGLKLDAQGQATNALVAYDDITLGTVTLGGANGTTITNLKAGALNASSTDAVNGSQLYQTNVNVAKNTSDITNLTTNFNNWTSDVDTGQVGIVRQDLKTRAITIGAATDGSMIDVKGTAGPRVITGVANGAVNQQSADAINGSQLYNAASSAATALGGGAAVDANGNVTAPTYHVGGITVNNVGAAIDNLDGRVTQNTQDIAALQGNVADVSEVAHNAVAYDSKDRNKVTLGGAGAGADAVQLTNVKNAELSASSSDAVNGSQLYATNQAVASVTGTVAGFQKAGIDYVTINSRNAPKPVASGTDAIAIGANSVASGNGAVAIGVNAAASANNAIAVGSNSVADQDNTMSVGSAGNERRITNVAPGVSGTDAANVNQLNAMRSDFGASLTSLQRGAFAGVAEAMAMPAFTPREAGKTLVTAAVGTYKGYSAVGAGATHRSRDGAWLVNLAFATTGHGDTGGRAAVSYEF
jgi:trimeric autotransporter adhesin